MPELRIKRGNTDELRPVNFRSLVNTLKGFRRQITELVLKRLQQRDDDLPRRTNPVDEGIYSGTHRIGRFGYIGGAITGHQHAMKTTLHTKTNIPDGFIYSAEDADDDDPDGT